MKVIIQRVNRASISVGNEENIISQIGKGLCLLVGINKNDSDEDISYIVKKILSLKLWKCMEKDWQKSVVEMKYEILSVSQFTLFANTKKGSKPDFHNAMPSKDSKIFYERFLNLLEAGYKKDAIKDGSFGEHMIVNIQNDGPVTIVLDSHNK